MTICNLCIYKFLLYDLQPKFVYRHTQSQTHTCNRKSVKSNQVPFLGTASKVISTLQLHAKCCLPSCVYSFRINNLVTAHLSPPCFLTFQIDDLIPLNRHLLTLISPWLLSPLSFHVEL